MSETAFVVHPYLKSDTSVLSEDEKLSEACELAYAINLDISEKFSVALRSITPATYIGKGKCEEINQLAEDKKPDVIIVNTSLAPVQQRNLEKLFKTKVIDRIGLILEIFGERAQTKEGKLQVELAALEYQKSRLVRSWTHLERQRGGAGFMGGPGETQIELDRRIIGERIVQIKKEIEAVRNNRDLQRRARDQVPYPVIAIVGYTNAGKSTLFNQLTRAGVVAKDMLFATLDTTMRKIILPSGQEAILSDTVGFISDLPTHLITAFRATLEQVSYADIILHVQDISSKNHIQHKKDVEAILEDMGIEKDAKHIMNVYNKVDLMSETWQRKEMKFSLLQECYISAKDDLNLDLLLQKIDKFLQLSFQKIKIAVPFENGKAISWLYSHGDVKNIEENENSIGLELSIHPRELGKFTQLFPDLSFETLAAPLPHATD